MNVPTHADIDCVDGFCGYTIYVILDLEKMEITHLVKDVLVTEVPYDGDRC